MSRIVGMGFTSASNKMHQGMFGNGLLKALESASLLSRIDYDNMALVSLLKAARQIIQSTLISIFVVILFYILVP